MTDTKRPLALVTGASSGIGVAYAQALAKRGWDLCLVARRGDRLKALAGALASDGAAVETVVADLADQAGMAQVAEKCGERPLALLVNNAGVAHYMPFATLPAQRAEEIVRVNTLAVVCLSSAAVPGMVARGKGAIINVASLLAFSGAMPAPEMPKRAVYAATKAFMVTFSQLLSSELAGTGVSVQVVCPGIVVSEFHTVQGMDLSARPRLAAEDMVKASLADLDAGVSVSIPTLEDAAAFGQIAAAQGSVLGAAFRPVLASRY